MKILMVIAEMGSGGAEAVVQELVRDLGDEDGGIAVATSGGWRTRALAQHGARLIAIPMRGRHPARLLRAARILRREVARRDVDLIHAHNVKASVVARLATLGMTRRPYVLVTMHGVADDRYAAATRLLRRTADQVVAVSSGVAQRLVEAGYSAQRLQVIENSLTPLPRHDRAQARARLGLPDSAAVAVCVARLARQKRHDLLVAAWAEMPADAVLLIAGEGATRTQIEREISASGQGERIRLLGERQDIDWLLAAADVCVLPTDWEGLPISVLEAMAAGVPVVASEVPELVAALSGAAQLVEPGSAVALADGLSRVLGDRDHARELADAGAELVHARFEPGRMCALYRRAYEDALSTEAIRR